MRPAPSHLHLDHLHLPSLREVATDAVIVVPRGAVHAVPGLRGFDVHEVVPGDTLDTVGARVEVLVAHEGRRWPMGRRHPPALGVRVEAADRSWWYPGDTGPPAQREVRPAGLGPVDLAIVPIGGWGPSLGPGHLTPSRAATAAAASGARFALPVHYGTYWPLALRPLMPCARRRLYLDPLDECGLPWR